MHVARRTALVVSAALVGLVGAPAAQAAKPTPVPKTISFVETSTAFVAENDQLLWVQLQRSVTKGKASVTIQASVAGGDTAEQDDIPSSPAIATFASGQGTATAIFPLPDDNEHEGDETFTVSITSVPKGFTGTDTLTVQINENDPAPPPPHPGTFTVDPGMKAYFGGFDLTSCNSVTAWLDRSDGAPVALGSNAGEECSDLSHAISHTVANNTLSPITLTFRVEDHTCGVSYSSDHTSTGTTDDVDHALTTQAEGYLAVDIHDGGENCDRQEDDAIPALDGGELEIDIGFTADPVTTGIWILYDGWTARFDQYVVRSCDNAVTAMLLVDGVPTETRGGTTDEGCVFSNDAPATMVNSSGQTKLLQFAIEDDTCGDARYTTSHTSTNTAVSVDHARIWDVGGGDFQIGIAHAGAGCANEDANVDPGFDGNFIPFIDLYQTSF